MRPVKNIFIYGMKCFMPAATRRAVQLGVIFSLLDAPYPDLPQQRALEMEPDGTEFSISKK
jgi:hypothetical protein